MRFRTGMVVGAAIGYVVGARAGRERYEQIKRIAGEARRHPAVAQIADQGLGLVDAGRYVTAAALSAGARGLKSLDTNETSPKSPTATGPLL